MGLSRRQFVQTVAAVIALPTKALAGVTKPVATTPTEGFDLDADQWDYETFGGLEFRFLKADALLAHGGRPVRYTRAY